jgi:hypothetical protein
LAGADNAKDARGADDKHYGEQVHAEIPRIGVERVDHC